MYNTTPKPTQFGGVRALAKNGHEREVDQKIHNDPPYDFVKSFENFASVYKKTI